jgi:diguanylate cyclase (GGDEF)-like protein
VGASRIVSTQTAKAQTATLTADLYQDAMFDAARQDGELSEYLSLDNQDVRAAYTATSRRLTTLLSTIRSTQDSFAIRDLINQQELYTATATTVLTQLDAGEPQSAVAEMRRSIETILTHIMNDLGVLAEAQHVSSAARLATVRSHAAALEVGTPLLLGLVLLLLVGLSLVTRAHRRNVEDQAQHDALTGLPNRLLFSDRATQAVCAAEREGAEPVVIMLDLDRFKEVNDTLGHQPGDHLLIQVAARISAAVRAGDTVSRLGGDEFAILLTAGGAEHGTLVAQRIAEALEPAFYLDGVTVSVEASMGIACLDAADVSLRASRTQEVAAELLRRADIAMYEAKLSHSGHAHHQPGSDDAPPARLALLGELREALHRDELVVHYQPKVSADNGNLLGVEALVRWQHPTRGLLPPAEFIALAEGTTLIQRLTTVVLDKALAMSREWLDRGVRMPVAVNVSARSLLDLEFPAVIIAQLAKAGVPADHLCLELTESTIMADPERALQILQQLRVIGVRLSVDDFGTGYSSMAYLKILPVDELKVDRSFVSNMTDSADDTMLVQSAIDLGHNLGMSVVAEGVEDHETLVTLKDLGADVIQGYYLGRPMDAASLGAWVNGRSDRETAADPETLAAI